MRCQYRDSQVARSAADRWLQMGMRTSVEHVEVADQPSAPSEILIQLTCAGLHAVIPRVFKVSVADNTTLVKPGTTTSTASALSRSLDTARRTFATGFRLGCSWCGPCGRRCHFDCYCGGRSIMREADNRAASVFVNMFNTPINSRKNTLLKPSIS